MATSDLRNYAFQANGAALRKYASELLEVDSSRSADADALELTAFFVECDFAGAEAKIDTLNFKYQGSQTSNQIISISNLVGGHIDFAFGRFKAMEERISSEINSFKSGNSTLEPADILQLLRIRSQKYLLLNEYEDLYELVKYISSFEDAGNHDQIYYLINSINAVVLASEGEHRKALEAANKNLKVAEHNGYTGVLSPFDSLFVKAISQMAMALPREAFHTLNLLRELSKKYQQWPWYFLANGNIARDFAINNKLSEALSIIREDREVISNMNLQNELAFFPDSSELFIRYLIKDVERIETLLNRLPNTNLVQQIRALKEEWSGRDMLAWTKALPEKTSREKIYKLFAFSDYYADKESISVDYMRQALVLVEETGSIEFLLRQHKLFDVIVKAAIELKTPFMEDIVRRITDRVRLNVENSRGELPIPLTTRELEVVRHLSTGKPISAISESLHVSMNTMKTHLRNIYRKLEVDGREKAVEKAKDLFLI